MCTGYSYFVIPSFVKRWPAWATTKTCHAPVPRILEDMSKSASGMSLISVSGKTMNRKSTTKQGLASQKRNMEQQSTFHWYNFWLHHSFPVQHRIDYPVVTASQATTKEKEVQQQQHHLVVTKVQLMTIQWSNKSLPESSPVEYLRIWVGAPG